MFSATLAIANAVQFSACSGVLRVLGLARADPSCVCSQSAVEGAKNLPFGPERTNFSFGYFPGVTVKPRAAWKWELSGNWAAWKKCCDTNEIRHKNTNMHTARPDKKRSGRVRAQSRRDGALPPLIRRAPPYYSVRLRIGTGTCGSCPFESWCSAIGAPMPVESSVATPGPAIDSAAGTEPLFVFSGAPVAQRAEPRAWEPRHLEARWPR